jgi:RHS repeat-associated protein
MRRILAQADDDKYDVPYHDPAFDTARQIIAAQPDQRDKDSYFRRLIEHVRTLYRRDDLTELLPLGVFDALALPGETYKLAFTSGLLNQVYQRGHEPLLPTDPANLLRTEGGYVPDDKGNWWVSSGRVFHSPSVNDTSQQELAHARSHFYLAHRYCDPFGASTIVAYDGSDADPAMNNDLLVVRTEDAVGNVVAAENDYRVLQPWRMTDPNGNRSEVRFDALGLIVGTAVMGKDGEPKQGDSFESFEADLEADEIAAYFDAADPRALAFRHLGTATTRIVYDLDRVPACAATIARETHVSEPGGDRTRLQLSFSYSDGFGREVQKKIQAEPGPVPRRNAEGGIVVADGRVVMTDRAANPRWVGSGWTIYDNKGHPVRQFEPFFSDTHRFDGDVRIGVSPWLFHDPLGRVVATLHPNHTWEKVVFDPWQQTTYDVNDTVLIAVRTDDPKRDSDATAFFGRLPDADYLPTWYELRTDAAHAAAFAIRYPGQTDRENEADAAKKAAAHAGTPTTTHFDALGRPFVTIARNRVVCTDHPLHEKPDEEFRTRSALDIEGNQREVIDERKLPDANNLPLGDLQQRIVMQYAYDMLGNRIHQLSMEAGARWMLNDVAGKPIRAWDSRGHDFTTTYDALRRPIEQYVRGNFSDPDPLKPNSDPRTLDPPNEAGLLVEKIEYGEPPPAATPAQEAEARRLNMRTRVFRHSDSAGIVTNARLDANGKPTEGYDFKGNLLCSTRQLVSDFKAIPDWSRNPRPNLDAETFEGSTRYDALSRPIQSVAPRSSLGRGKFNIVQPVFNEANLLERVYVWLERATEPAALLDPAHEAPSPVGVANIDYDAKGQRILIDYETQDATVIRTTYAYDRETFRLTHLYTRRGVDPATAQGVAFTDDCDNPDLPPPDTIAAPEKPPAGKGCGLQNLHYAYDPAGNITRIRDDAQQTLYFKNQRVESSNDYVYDALYRLIQAEGREHLGQAGAPIPHSYNDGGRAGILSANPGGHFAPNDRSAMGRYTERYVYDAVGNFLQMQHARGDDAVPDWTRRYAYAQASLIEPGKRSNRVSSTAVGNAAPEPYRHDTHGNMLGMPQLHTMQWDYRDQLQLTERQKVNEADADGVERHGERTWYVYDASGQRVRKVTELANNGGIKDERIYLGGFEVFRSYQGPANARVLKLERETLHVMDDKQRIALVEMRTLGDEQDVSQRLIRYQFGNHLGSSSLEIDEQAQVISYEEYAPYGSSTYQAVRSQTEAAKRYRYTGKERDEESGISYHGARYYLPWLGRWTTTDPICRDLAIGSKSDLDRRSDKDLHSEITDRMVPTIVDVNLYAYVEDRPTVLVDSSGLSPVRIEATTASAWKTAFERKLDVKGRLYDRGGTTKGEEADKTLRKYGESEGFLLSQKPTGKTSWMQKPDDKTPTGESKRYIYTKKGGWIDMAHFLFYAGRARENLDKYRDALDTVENRAKIFLMNRFGPHVDFATWRDTYARDLALQATVQEGRIQEYTDEESKGQQKLSAYSYEDLPSDKFGADFAINFFDPKSDKTLAEQLDAYLQKLNATDPDRAPNWANVTEENVPEHPIQNFSTTPMYTAP